MLGQDRFSVRDDLVAELYRVYLDVGIVLSQHQIANAVEYRLKQKTCQSTVRNILKRRGFDTSVLRSGTPLAETHGEEKVRQVVTDYVFGRMRMREARRALRCSATAIRHHMRLMGFNKKVRNE